MARDTLLEEFDAGKLDPKLHDKVGPHNPYLDH